MFAIVNEYAVFFAALFVMAITGCGQSHSHAKDEQKQAEQTSGGRSETETLQAAGLVGYDGKQLRKNVDKVLDAKDQRNKELEDRLHETDDP